MLHQETEKIGYSKPPLTSQPSLPERNYHVGNNQGDHDDVNKLPRHFATPNHHRTLSSGPSGHPRNHHPGYFTPQPNRKSYIEQLNQAKAENLRLAVLSDEESSRRAQSGAEASLQRRFSTSSANVEVDYLHSDDGNGQIGFFGGMFSCLRPVWAMVGGKGGKVTAGYSSKSFGDISLNSIANLEFVTSGAQGAVYSGWHQGRRVAVKKLRSRAEIDILKNTNLSSIRHPNIVEILGVCWSPFAIVMEFCAGGPLYRVLRDSSAVVTPILIIEWARQIASAMQYLHIQNIVHRDLKSPNCLIGQRNQIKLIDFGNCKKLSNDIAQQHMSFTGTFAWMAPEVIRNEHCNEKLDIWSYGVVLWELVTREVPYASVDSSAIIWGVGSNRLSLPIPNSCPTPLRILLSQCWRQKFKERPSFAQILLHLDIWAVDFVQTPYETLIDKQASWRNELKTAFEKINKEGGGILELQRMDNEIVNQHRNELKQAQDVRSCYEEKLSRANSLMTELQTVLVELDHREQVLRKREEEVESIMQLKKTTKSSIAQLNKLIQRQSGPGIPASSPKNQSDLNTDKGATLQSSVDLHRRRSQTLKSVDEINSRHGLSAMNQSDLTSPVIGQQEWTSPTNKPKARIMPRLGAATTLMSLNLTPTRTRASRNSLRVNMFKREQRSSKSFTTRPKSIESSSTLNNRSSANSSTICTPLAEDTISYGVIGQVNNTSGQSQSRGQTQGHRRQTSTSLVGSAKQRITRNNSNKFVAGNHPGSSRLSDCSSPTRNSENESNTLEHHLKKDKALALWKGNVVQNSIMSSSLDRNKFTNLKQNMQENRLRRISRSLNNLQEEFHKELLALSTLSNQGLNPPHGETPHKLDYNSGLSDGPEFLEKSTTDLDFKNNLVRQQLYSEGSLQYLETKRRSLKIGKKMDASRCCCNCDCHLAPKRDQVNFPRFPRSAKDLEAVSPTSSNTTTLSRPGHTKDKAANMLSSEDDTLDFEEGGEADRDEDVFEERERNLELFLQKINAELQLCTNAQATPHNNHAMISPQGGVKTPCEHLLSSPGNVSHSRHSSDPVFLSPETPELFAPSFKFLYS